MPTSNTELTQLRSDIHRAGYYPAIVVDILNVALAGEEVLSHFVHVETMFDRSEVRRHITVLVLTPTRLIVAHVDDLPGDGPDEAGSAAATTEAVPIAQIGTVALTHGIADPATHAEGDDPTDLTMAIAWGAVNRLDLEPATCGDPTCEADHGLAGTSMADDLLVRVSAMAEGPDAIHAAMRFAAALSAATTGR